MNDLRDMLLAAFQEEHKQYLEGMRALWPRVEQGTATPAELEEIFRLAHSLKAAARVCDLPIIETLGRQLETLFSRLRQGTLQANAVIGDAVRTVLQAIEEWAANLADGSSPVEPTHALQVLEAILAQEPAATLRRIDLQSVQPLRTDCKSILPPDGTPHETDELSARLLAAFQVEQQEHLEGIRAFLARGEREGTWDRAGVDEAFRRAHSLKGAARIAECRAAETLAHRLETLFARVREGVVTLGRDVVRVIHLALDAIEDSAAALGAHQPPPDTAGPLAAIERLVDGQQSERPAAPRTAPPTRATDGPKRDAAVSALTQPGPPAGAVESMRVSADNLDRLLRSTGQLLTENLRQDRVTRELTSLGRQIKELAREWEALRRVAPAALRQLAETPALVPVVQYLDLVEHQVRSLARQARAVRLLQEHSSWALGRLGNQLRQDVRRVRLVSAESIFQGFRKMMRDLARDEGKELEFNVNGFEIEADRLVLQALKDPLMHILCNAVSHGLEPPEERRARGKDPVGRVTLELHGAGNRLTLRVEDDGRGVDQRKVAEVAVRCGFLSEAEAAAAAPEELSRLIFRPGFTTARGVTGVAGRGMGLSVVVEAVARLRGEVELRPGEQGGTIFALSVPLAIATQRLLLVSCRGQTFAIPVEGIERLFRIKVEEVETVEGRPMLLHQGQLVPLLPLARLLRIEAGVSVENEALAVMLLRAGARRVAVAVDGFLAERDCLIKDLDQPAASLPTLAGGILLEDGSVALVLNPTELVHSFRPTDKVAPLQTAPPVVHKTTPTVLIVDDSLTTRTLEKSILEAHGYEVRLAVDGLQALQQLRTELVDLVITDIQMPRLDGFGLLEEMKKDQRLARVPVIVVTSLERREDQERGLALGADAYVLKRKFDHEDLLATIRQIL